MLGRALQTVKVKLIIARLVNPKEEEKGQVESPNHMLRANRKQLQSAQSADVV